jgi:hypothetical protein
VKYNWEQLGEHIENMLKNIWTTLRTPKSKKAPIKEDGPSPSNKGEKGAS